MDDEFYEKLGFVKPTEKRVGRSAVTKALELVYPFKDEEWMSSYLDHYPTVKEFIHSDNKCFYCECEFDVLRHRPEAKTFTIDHFWPLSKGGFDDFCNSVKSCYSCNITKSDDNPIDFWISMYVKKRYNNARTKLS